jgi:tetratricopeptide (TPR) repeat protein
MGYTAKEVALLLELPVSRVHAFVRAGFLSPERAGDGALSFSFQDLVLLRTAKGLCDANVAPTRVKRALKKLKDQLPEGRPLTAVAISAEGNKVVVRDGRVRWNPESGQALLDFEVRELERKVAPLAEAAAKKAKTVQTERSADEWFALGCELEIGAPVDALDAYRHAVGIDPLHADAWVNLGRMAHETGALDEAERCYRAALDARTGDAIAAFNLGLVLQSRGADQDAIVAFEQALVADPQCADAHYNAARLYERMGEQTAALRHLRAFKKLTDGR